jgi:hypothetical protein
LPSVGCRARARPVQTAAVKPRSNPPRTITPYSGSSTASAPESTAMRSSRCCGTSLIERYAWIWGFEFEFGFETGGGRVSV